VNDARRRLLQAGLALAAAPARGAMTSEAALKAATGPGWAAWPGATPPLALPGLDGRRHALADYRGYVVIVNFWASWCEPCRDEIPAMSALARRHREQGLRLLAVNNGEARAKVDAFLARWPVSGTVLHDRNGQALRDWSVAAMPANYLVDRQGRLRRWHLGALDWNASDIAEAALALLRS